jgi:uncharacterized membrane protein
MVDFFFYQILLGGCQGLFGLFHLLLGAVAAFVNPLLGSLNVEFGDTDIIFSTGSSIHRLADLNVKKQKRDK